MKRAIGYIRVSTEEQAASGLGLSAQLESLKAYAEKNELEIARVFADKGVSGAVDVDRRDAMMQAFQELREGDVFLVPKVDRIGRDMFVLATVSRMVVRIGASIAYADGSVQGDGPEAELMGNLLAAFAVYERAMIRARTRAALRAKKMRGEDLGSAPFGMRYSKGRLVVDGKDAPHVAAILDMHEQGMSRRAIARELNRRGVKGKRGGTWTHVGVAALLARFETADLLEKAPAC